MMGFAENYFRKQSSFKPSIHDEPKADLAYIIVIPATKEKDLMHAVRSLYFCNPVKRSFEIIILINAAADAPAQTKEINRKSFNEVIEFGRQYNDPCKRVFPILMNDLMPRDAGVGLARKLGMDEALWRFNLINRPEGIIVCFDADATCDTNFLSAIEEQVLKFPATKGCSVYFEHDIDNDLYSLDQRKAITSYEIHLRYYKQALKYIGFPYSFHTVGSSMLVNALVYAQQGGMNKHKAGEDFYFLQKIMPLGEFHEINTTRILLSPRESDRVPFGTGAAIVKMLNRGVPEFETFDLKAFLELKEIFSRLDELFRLEIAKLPEFIQNLPALLRQFLNENPFDSVVLELNENSSTLETFRKRFFQWWNAFRILKFLNYAHSGFYLKKDATLAAEELLQLIVPSYSGSGNSRQILETLRNLEKL